MKRIIATINVVSTFSRMYRGTPVSLQQLSVETKYSMSYLEQIFVCLKRHGIVSSVRGPGGGYHIIKQNLCVADVIRSSTQFPNNACFDRVLQALEKVPIDESSDEDTIDDVKPEYI
ncbi:transcriptional regulator [Klebsiella oxytoca]|nr:transcriptional regulator [Klebsiella oxytoca]